MYFFSGVITLNSQYGCYYYKNGNTVFVNCDFGGINVPSSGILLGILPDEYSPSLSAYCRNGFDNQNGQLCIAINGEVKLESFVGDFNYGHFCVSYPAKTGFSYSDI